MALTRAFFYGTVMRDQPNHGDLGDAPFLGDTRTAARYALFTVDRLFPALSADGTASIAGELYSLDEQAWERIIELDPPWMSRQAIELEDGSQAESMLIAAPAPSEVVLSDISSFAGWRAYLATRSEPEVSGDETA
jgi:gamma-glutamylcyclotransferase (GGCT)/AIG2-like uncharacterized protein YtfP